MLLKHMHEPPEGVPAEDSFEALDERSGETRSSCCIYYKVCTELFPACPLRIFLDLSDDPAPDALLGAAVARSREIAAQAGEPAHIFTQVRPDDRQRMAALAVLGFKDNDGLVRMRRELPAPAPGDLPYGCVLICDTLEDPIEQKYFLERYNRLYSEKHGFDWLQSYRAREDFGRILIVSPKGMVGEVICWRREGAGVIGWLHVAKRWRRHGISQVLLSQACARCSELGLTRAEAEIQVRIPYLLRSLESAGFYQAELLMRYPSLEV